jgi:hypothetical protein
MTDLLESNIAWTSEPVPRLEDTDPMSLNEDSLWTHVYDLRSTVRALREVAHAATHRAAESEQKNLRLRQRLHELTTLLRDRSTTATGPATGTRGRRKDR